MALEVFGVPKKVCGAEAAAADDVDDDEDKSLLGEALKSAPVPPRKQTMKEVMKKPSGVVTSALKKPSMQRSYENFKFVSKSFGECKAEFYSHKSYIRMKVESTGKYTLVIQTEGVEHQQRLYKLVDFAKKDGMTKEKLVEIRKDI